MKKPLIICEIGINHQGDLVIAKKLINLSHKLGADFVKFQKRCVELVYSQEQLNSPRISKWGKTYRDQKLGLEFSREEYNEIVSYCKKIGIGWFASPWDVKSVEFLKKYNLPFIKIASPCLTSEPLLKAVKKMNVPVIVSTGMSTEQEISKSLNLLDKNVEYLLHCVSSYPTLDKEMNMSCLTTLKNKYPNYKIGFSNHSPKIIYCVQAMIMGAEMIEFHITLDRNMEGSDHQSSIGPIGFKRIMSHINSIIDGYGDGKIGVSPSEIPIKEKLRKNYV